MTTPADNREHRVDTRPLALAPALTGLYPSVLCSSVFFFFFFNDTATTEIYTLSLHDALPISLWPEIPATEYGACKWPIILLRSEEHTSELQSRQYLVCRLLLEKKKKEQMLAGATKARTTAGCAEHGGQAC